MVFFLIFFYLLNGRCFMRRIFARRIIFRNKFLFFVIHRSWCACARIANLCNHNDNGRRRQWRLRWWWWFPFWRLECIQLTLIRAIHTFSYVDRMRTHFVTQNRQSKYGHGMALSNVECSCSCHLCLCLCSSMTSCIVCIFNPFVSPYYVVRSCN